MAIDKAYQIFDILRKILLLLRDKVHCVALRNVGYGKYIETIPLWHLAVELLDIR